MTTNYDIRAGSPLDPATTRLGEYAFSSTPRTVSDEERARYLAGRETDRVFFSYNDNEEVAKVTIIPMTMNVRGVVVPMGGISGVASMPAARRGGHIRQLLLRSIQDMHEQGEVISALYPFKTSYYEMFGYAGWQAPVWVHIDPAALAPFLKTHKTGRVRQRLSSETIDDHAVVLKAAQQRIHGMSLFTRHKQDAQAVASPRWITTVHEGDEITAGLSYALDLDKHVMVVRSMYWSTFNGKVNILDFLARHVDQVKTIQMPLLPGDDPHLWTTHDGSIDIITNDPESWGPSMARVVNVAGLTGVGAGEGAVCLKVTDDQAPWNDGVFTFTASDGRLLVHEGGNAEGHVTIHGLAALLFSGIDPQLLPIRGWGRIDPEAYRAVQALFPREVPFIHAFF